MFIENNNLFWFIKCRNLIINNLERIYSLIMVENNNQSRIKEIRIKKSNNHWTLGAY